MLRVAVTQLALFLTPFVLYAAYLLLARRPMTGTAWSGPTLGWLSLAGLGVAAAALFMMAEFSGAPRGSIYVPPAYVDGQLVPGHFITPEEQAARGATTVVDP